MEYCKVCKVCANILNHHNSCINGEKMTKDQSSEKILNVEPYYFELQATLGVTNHMGGLKATQELAELCRIDKDTSVLDVGCGIGATTIYLGNTYDCRIVGADIREEMVAKSKKRAQKGIHKNITFQVGDAENLPFENNSFDIVISESVTAFVHSKERAIAEYSRVAKPGGYIGLNETTWITPPPENLVTYLSRTMGVRPESPETWEALLKSCKLHDIVVNPCKTTIITQWINEVKMTPFIEVVKPWGRLFSLYFKDPLYRKVIHEMVKESMNIPRNIFDYFGYGLYVGRK